MIEQIKIADLKKTMPWRQVIHPNGQVMMINNGGQEVALLTMTAFMESITAHLAKEIQPQT